MLVFLQSHLAAGCDTGSELVLSGAGVWTKSTMEGDQSKGFEGVCKRVTITMNHRI